MLVLYETAAGFSLFKVGDKLGTEADVAKHFSTAESAAGTVKLAAFKHFKGVSEALKASVGLCNSKLSKPLRKFLEKELVLPQLNKLVVADDKLGSAIAAKLGLEIMRNTPSVCEMYRGIREHITALLPGVAMKDMALGLSHSLSRHKIKFTPDKVDAMIVQAIGLLDELDKEINTYAMRVKEWYGWHFPELARIVLDNAQYARTVVAVGFRANAKDANLDSILPEGMDAIVIEAAAMSMGTDITQEDVECIQSLCHEIVELSAYKTKLSGYMAGRMQAIAPNLTTLLGDIVGARLIAHAGSLLSLAKCPASTIQIFGAEKALFRALKAKKDTPKYGMLFHAPLVTQAQGHDKGKIARFLAARTAISVRVDALHEGECQNVGSEAKAMVERRLRELEERGQKKTQRNYQSYQRPSQPVSGYNPASDFTVPDGLILKRKKKSGKPTKIARNDIVLGEVAEMTALC